MSNASSMEGPYARALQRKKAEFRSICSLLSKEGVLLHEENIGCDHEECKNNVIDVSTVDNIIEPGPRYRRWCTYAIAPEKAKKLALVTAPVSGLRDLSPFMDDAGIDVNQHAKNMNEGMKTITAIHGQQQSSSDIAAAGARHRALLRLTEAETDNCSFTEINRKEEAARSRARGLAAMTRMDGPVHCDCEAPSNSSRGQSQSQPYLKRHKYELPKDRARLFETTTPAWEDSGKMPNVMYTVDDVARAHDACIATQGLMDPSVPSVAGQTTTTGAMMEFMGPQVGSEMPFRMDQATSIIDPSAPPFGGQTQGPASGAYSDEQMMRELDELIAATTSTATPVSSGHQSGTASGDVNIMPPVVTDNDAWQTRGADPFAGVVTATSAEGFQPDIAMDDFDFNDVTFDDGVFDLPMGGDFGLDGNGL
jgi:hypothetical protein